MANWRDRARGFLDTAVDVMDVADEFASGADEFRDNRIEPGDNPAIAETRKQGVNALLSERNRPLVIIGVAAVAVILLSLR